MREASEAGESHTGLASARCPGGNKGGAGSTHRLYPVTQVAPGCLLGYEQSTLIILISACVLVCGAM